MPGRTAIALLAVAVITPLSGDLSLAEGGARDSRAWAELVRGRADEFSWSAKAHRASEGPTGPQACVRVAIRRSRGAFSFTRTRFTECAGRRTLSGGAGTPVVAGGALLGPVGSRAAMTAFGMLLPPAVERVEIRFSDGRVSTIPAVRPTPAGLSEIGIGRFRYAVVALRGAACVEEIVTRDTGRVALWRGGAGTGAC